MNLAVMSDLHIGLAARSKDICPKPPRNRRKERSRYERKVEDNFRQNFIDFIQSNNLSADYLILPGDITDSAQPREVHLASEFIIQVADALHVSQDKILFTPGNHDVDWTVFDPNDDTGIRWGQRYDPIGHNNYAFRPIIEQGDGDILSAPYFIVWEFDDLLVVAYNSSSHDTPSPKEAIHHGLADQNHIYAIRERLTQWEQTDGRIRLFMVHHHMIDFNSPMPNSPDFSLMTNSDGLLSLLHDFEFDLIIHGHKHHPRFDTHSTQTHSHIPILCSGSLSVEIDTQWSGTIDNQFHMITFNGRAGEENLLTGIITSWSNNRVRGWIPSEELTSGIHHVIPFGSYVMPHELDRRLDPFIRQWLEHHDHILWRNIVEEFPDLEHLPVNSAIEAFKRISRSLGRTIMHQTQGDLMLY